MHQHQKEGGVTGQTLKVMDKFPYLGSTISRCVHIDAMRLMSASPRSVTHLGQVKRIISFEGRGIKITTKLKVYKATMLPTLL